MNAVSKRTLHWAGSCLSIIGIVFLVWRLHRYWTVLDPSIITASIWISILALSVLCGIANLLLAFSWRQLLLQFDGNATRWWSTTTYGISHMARYLPGNIFHLAGRQAIGLAAGIPGKALAKSALWEIGLIAWAGAGYGLLILPLMFPKIMLLKAIVIFLGFNGLCIISLRKFINGRVAIAFCFQTLFLAFSGAVFSLLTSLLSSGPRPDFQTSLLLCGTYIVAWLAGLVTPGAPAGIGVRELVVLFLSNGIMAESELLLSITIVRIITIFGDLWFFLFSAAAQKRWMK